MVVTVLTITIIYKRDQTAWIIMAISTLIIVNFFTCLAIISSFDRHIKTKISWIFIIWGFPIIGNLVFIIFGLNLIKKRKIQEYNSQQIEYVQTEDFSDTRELIENNSPLMQKYFTYTLNTSSRPVYKNSYFELILSGVDFMEKAVETIRKAKKTIDLQYYIVRKGTFFTIIVNELIKKAREGIKIRFLYDGVGSLWISDKKLLKYMKEEGINIGVFNWSKNPINGFTNYRSHRKCIIADNQEAIIGGFNIGDEYLSLNENYGFWRDTNLLVKGKTVNTYTVVFNIDWNAHRKKSKTREESKNLHVFKGDFTTNNYCQVIDSGPDHEQRQIKDMLVKLILQAKKSFWISTPYLLPSEDILTALKASALSGVDVRIIVPGKSDNKKYFLSLSRSHYKELINSNVKIYEYKSFNHSKVCMIDEETAMIGSFNLDFRSLFVNFEIATLITGKEDVKIFKNMFLEDFSNSLIINPSEIKEINFWKRVFYLGVFYVWHPML